LAALAAVFLWTAVAQAQVQYVDIKVRKLKQGVQARRTRQNLRVVPGVEGIQLLFKQRIVRVKVDPQRRIDFAKLAKRATTAGLSVLWLEVTLTGRCWERARYRGIRADSSHLLFVFRENKVLRELMKKEGWPSFRITVTGIIHTKQVSRFGFSFYYVTLTSFREPRDSDKSREGKKPAQKEEKKEKQKRWEDAPEHRTEHYILKARGISKLINDLKRNLDRFCRAFYNCYTGKMNLRRVTEPLAVWVYENRQQYLQHGGTGSAHGWYNQKEKRVETYLRPKCYVDMWHNMTHQLMHLAAGLPQYKDVSNQWLHEGFACYLEGCETDEHDRFLQQEEQDRHDRLAQLWKQNKLLPLRDVLSANGRTFAQDRARYEAQAWSFVHFLLQGGKGQYSELFFKYIREEQKVSGKGGFELFRRVFSEVDFQELERSWKAHVEGMCRYVKQRDTSAGEVEQQVK
jgi:hypothetical protein